MKTETLERVNVTPSSSEGHFVKGAKKVICLDKINETFLVDLPEGKEAILETKNHTSLNIVKRCLITCQVVYNPFSKMFTKSRD